MENLNAEKVKRGLQYCANNDECVGEACPYYTTDCENNMPKDALALINSQEQRIKELAEEVASWEKITETYQKQFEDCAEDRAKLTEENERLHASCTELTRKMQDNVRAENEELRKSSECDVRKLKADTVRKMHQRIKEDAIAVSLLSNPPKFMLEIREDALDQIAKEMLQGAE